jgi:hypothetical protein
MDLVMSNSQPLTENAVNYTLCQLAQRCGLLKFDEGQTGFEELGLSVFYGFPEQKHFSSPAIVIRSCDENSWMKILNAPVNSLHWVPVKNTLPHGVDLPFSNAIPVLFWGSGFEDGRKPFAEHAEDGSVIFNADILASSFFMLSRWEETVVFTRDRHNRFPASASVAYKQEFLHLPIVDQYGYILQAWLQVLIPSWEPSKKEFSVKLSFDIDHVREFRSICSFVSTLGGDLIKKQSLRKAFKTFNKGITDFVNPKSNPIFQGIIDLSNYVMQFGMFGAFYFKASRLTTYDSGYKPEWTWVKALIYLLRDQGFEIGLHPSYETVDNFQRLLEEKKRFDRILGGKKYGGRQHYLRFKVPDTWLFWEKAGFTYDSSMGYHDYEGFRCGTCFPYRPFDTIGNRQMKIVEIPLIVMDGTLAVYRELSAEQGEKNMLELAKRCCEVGGVYTLLWHNSSLHGNWEPWAEAYKRVVSKLAIMTKAQSDF